MLYQLSYALKPHYQVSTFGEWKIHSNHRQSNLLPSLDLASNEETNYIRNTVSNPASQSPQTPYSQLRFILIEPKEFHCGKTIVFLDV
jgi:hypothetical protein